MDEMNMDDMSDVDEECKINETMYEEQRKRKPTVK